MYIQKHQMECSIKKLLDSSPYIIATTIQEHRSSACKGTEEEMINLLSALFSVLDEKYDVRFLMQNVLKKLESTKKIQGDLLIIAHLNCTSTF